MDHLRTGKRPETLGTHVSSGCPERKGAMRGERGIALVLALMMLALLGILGSMAHYTSTSELRIAGNYRVGQEAFFVADTAVEYAYTDPDIYTSIVPGPQPNPDYKWPKGAPFQTQQFPGPTTTNEARIRVEWEDCGQPPVGSGGSAEAALGMVKPNKNNYYLVRVIGSVRSRSETAIAIESRQGRLALSCPGE